MEKIVQKRLEWFVKSNNILSKSQCGFRQGLSTIDVLLRLENIIRSSLEAFDRVHHAGLLSKLAGAGINGNNLAWIKNYLFNRKMFVRVGDVLSDPCLMDAGCPQGAILSPLLLNIMLSDLPVDDAVRLLSYADDITLVLTGKDEHALQNSMQLYLTRVVWSWHVGVESIQVKCTVVLQEVWC